MNRNPYAAPTRDSYSEVPDTNTAAGAWFPVGIRKLCIMSLLTVGVYAVYWFERQYRFQKRARGESTWPLARGIFSVFFANDLFKRVDAAARAVSIRPEWQPGALAGIYIAAVVAGRVFHYAGQHLPLGSRAFLAFLSITSTVVGFVYVTMQVQSTVKDVLKREYWKGDPNEHLTFWNWIACALGGLFWALAIVGLLLAPSAAKSQDAGYPAVNQFEQ